MNQNEPRFAWLVLIGQGFAWLATSFGALLTALFLREALLDIMELIGGKRLEALQERGMIGQELGIIMRISAIDFISIFLLAVITVTATVMIDGYFSKGRAKGLLLKRILTIAGIEIGVIVGSVLLRILLQA